MKSKYVRNNTEKAKYTHVLSEHNTEIIYLLDCLGTPWFSPGELEETTGKRVVRVSLVELPRGERIEYSFLKEHHQLIFAIFNMCFSGYISCKG